MRSLLTGTEVQIVLVEDDSVDAEAVRRAFRKQRIAKTIEVCQDGESALDYLRSRRRGPAARPCMILLDLNMPRMNGIEFLQEVRSDPDLQDSVVFVLTTSDHERDKRDAYAYNVAGYLVKSRVGEDFVDVLRLLEQYWRIVELPPEDRA
jgi:CheY-like chemotaxis protein